MSYFIGVDVGTASVRAGLYDQQGKLLKFQNKDIKIFNFKLDYYEQSSNDIWNSVCYCIKCLVNYNGRDISSEIASIAFDATCSLVVLDENKQPISVSESQNDDRNIIMWMDHRATKQADFINSTKHSALNSVGGKISPEMDPPKILWLKQNMFDCYKKAAYFYSLPDYLFMKCTNDNGSVRSMCCVTCKWLYKANENENCWDDTFWSSIGLDDLVGYDKIGSNIRAPCSYLENSTISIEASKEIGLSTSTKVGISLIDAHAGGIGGIAVAMGVLSYLNQTIKQENILVLVSGTSSCHMASSIEAQYVSGIWGPYYNAMLPNLWLNEAGQSVCGKLIDFIIETHPAYIELKSITSALSISIYEYLHGLLIEQQKSNNLTDVSMLTRDFHLYPDFYGNRSPLSDSSMKGAIFGLTIDKSIKNLALVYLSCLQALAYQTKHIMSTLGDRFHFKLIVIIGGLAKNSLYCQLHSDVCDLPVIIPHESDSTVLLGSCISGACNTKRFSQMSFDQVLKQFSGVHDDLSFKHVKPSNDNAVKNYHLKKYRIFLNMIEDQRKYNSIMND